MIEFRNIKMFDDRKAMKEGNCQRLHLKDSVNSVRISTWIDEDAHYVVSVELNGPRNVSGLFGSADKAVAFYDAVKALLPDSDAQNAVIDHKDFE